MTTNEFNEKYKEYLEEGHYGLAIRIPTVVDYIDEVFEGLIKIPGFKYTQIKLKFDTCRLYTNLHDVMGKLGVKINNTIEDEIDFLVKVDDEVRKQLEQKEG
jgi:L-cysteine desulfidase